MKQQEKKSLFRITDEMYRLNTLLEEAEGEITPEIEELMEMVDEDQFDQKVESYVNLIQMLESDVTATKEYKKGLDASIKRDQRVIDRLKSTLSDSMLALGKKEKRGPGFKVSFRKSTAAVIDPEAKIPKKYIVSKPSVDKRAILAALKEGKRVRGAKLEERQNIQIK